MGCEGRGWYRNFSRKIIVKLLGFCVPFDVPGIVESFSSIRRAQFFTYELESTLGQFYSGSIRSFGAEFGFRIQPWVNFGLSFQYDSLRFPKPYSSADILLMTSKTEVTLSKKLFWNTLIQFSNQRDNLGINSRLQWRFAPLSDLYLVYNDNYFTKDQLRPKFRSINLKLTYWINW